MSEGREHFVWTVLQGYCNKCGGFLWFSDEMYAAIEEPGQVYMSGSETYAQIQPLAVLDVTSEANSDGSHYPPQPPSVDSLKHVAQVHSRQGQ